MKRSRPLPFLLILTLCLCLGLAPSPQRAWSQDAPAPVETTVDTTIETTTETTTEAAVGTTAETPATPPALAPAETPPPAASPTESVSQPADPAPLPTAPILPSQLNLQPSPAPAPAVEPARSPVILNDRPVISVSAAAGLTAQSRALAIRDRLDRIIDTAGVTGEAPLIEIRESNDLPTLLVNGEQLVTVISTDVPAKATPAEIAETWSEKLRQQLKIAIEEKQPDFWRARAITALKLLCSALVLDFLFRWLWGQFRAWVVKQLEVLSEQDPLLPQLSEKSRGLLDFGFRSVATLLLLTWWLGAFFYTADLFPATRRFSLTLRDLLVETVTAPLVPLGSGYSVLQLLMLAVMLMALVVVAGALTDLLKSKFLSMLGIGRGVQEAIAIVFRYCFITLSSIVLLQLWGIDLSSLTILASALGVGIGFGFQDIAKNFGSGLVLVFERPIQVGDFIEVGGYSGTIEKLGARSTTIRTLDNLDVFVPNSRFLEEEVTNWSHARSPSRLKLPIGVAYGADLEQVQEALLEAAQSSKNVLKTPEPTVLFEGFGDSALDFVLLVWIARPQHHSRIRSELNFKIDAAFRRREIEIPFPQRDLHLRSGNLPIEMLRQDRNGTAQAASKMDIEELTSSPD